MTPEKGYEYDDSFARNVAFMAQCAVYGDDPRDCLGNQLPTTTFYKSVNVTCNSIGPNSSTCFAYTAYDDSRKAIMVVFRGTIGALQMADEFASLLHKKEPFFDNGHVFKYFYDAFQFLWNAGLESALRSLKYLYPNYQLWVFGHSLGGAEATVFASYVVRTGIYPPENVRLLTFGQPRTGDKDFAKWHDSTFHYSYRVNKHRDIVPHVPPLGGEDEVWHHRYEVWYNNNMTLGAPYTICHEGDGPYCSNLQLEDSVEDHLTYFNIDMVNWIPAGCPKN